MDNASETKVGPETEVVTVSTETVEEEDIEETYDVSKNKERDETPEKVLNQKIRQSRSNSRESVRSSYSYSSRKTERISSTSTRRFTHGNERDQKRSQANREQRQGLHTSNTFRTHGPRESSGSSSERLVSHGRKDNEHLEQVGLPARRFIRYN